MKKSKILYRKNSSGKLQQWQIGVDGSTIHTWHGQVDGKLQHTHDTILLGKNEGRSNATTPEEQAISEAKSKFTKMKKMGYVTSKESALADEVDAVIEGGIIPMLAQSYKKKPKFPCYVQPKLDGIRGLHAGNGSLWSRTRHAIKCLPHLEKQHTKYFGDQLADGEFYNHELKHDFEKITAAVTMKKGISPHHELVQHHIYDLPIPDLTFRDRYAILEGIFEEIPGNSHLILVPTRLVNSHAELMKAYEDFMEMGYEGAMARDPEGLYENPHAKYRSKNLQKIKEFQDAEFRIVGFYEGRGKYKGHLATFECEIDDEHGKRTFKAMPMGDLGKAEMMKKMFEDHSLWKGKWVTVQFQGWTRTDNKPRFPKAKRFRDMKY